MKITLSNKLQIKDCSPSALSEIKSGLTIVNPTWAENEKMGRWQGETPYILRYYQETSSGLILPRLARALGVRVENIFPVDQSRIETEK